MVPSLAFLMRKTSTCFEGKLSLNLDWNPESELRNPELRNTIVTVGHLSIFIDS